jgi:hypothetical protein
MTQQNERNTGQSLFNSFVKMTCVILPLAEGESRPARSAAAGGQFGDFLCKAHYWATFTFT